MASIIDLDQALEILAAKVVRTDKGSFIRVDDLRELASELQAERKEEKARPAPKDFNAAKMMALANEELKKSLKDEEVPLAIEGVKS